MKHLYLVLLVCLPVIILSLDGGAKPFAVAAADDDDDVDDDVDVEGEGEDTAMTDEGGDEDDGTQTGASPDAATTILFTKPVSVSSTVETLLAAVIIRTEKENLKNKTRLGNRFSFSVLKMTAADKVLETSTKLPAGHMVEFLVGFQNKGKQDFIVETLETSFRYPMDFSFYIQNFSMIAYNKVVKPTHEATLAYSFLTPESFAGRPFGLSINLQYRDFEGNLFGESVFNETVNIVELEEGLDGETFFLYVFLAALVVLLLVISQQFLVSVKKKRVGKKPVIETGTSNRNQVDLGWLPKGHLNNINKMSPKSSHGGNKNHKSPKASKHQSPKASKQHQSPKQRKAKRSAGRDD